MTIERNHRNLITYCITSLIAAVMAAPGAFASDVGALVQFQANTTARASEVNQNFDDVKTAVNSKLDQTIGSCAAGSSIRVIAPDGSVTCEIDDAGAGGGGDITGVIAGTGLSGGGLNGDVTLSVGTGAINATHLGTGSVTNSEIQDGTIFDADVSPSAAIAVAKIAGDTGYEVGGFWTNSNVSTGITSLGSINVTVPGPGQVLLFMGGTALLEDDITLTFGIGVSASAYVASSNVGFVGATGNTTSFHSLSRVVGYTVGSAGTFTFHALADKNDISTNGNNASVSAVNLIAIYVPKRY
jgi:hypothetical protein